MVNAYGADLAGDRFHWLKNAKAVHSVDLL